MELIPPLQNFHLRKTHRLIPGRFPPVEILDRVASPDDLDAVIELEGWTNDRMAGEIGILQRVPRSEWVLGVPNASVIMAAYCHPKPEGSRFTDDSSGAWYAAASLRTAHAEVLYHRKTELAEVGISSASLTMREYVAGFRTEFHSLLENNREFDPLYDPASYGASQAFGRNLRSTGSNGIVYRSVRDPGGTCIACFRPRFILSVKQGAHFEYRLSGDAPPHIRRIRIENRS